jgi:hypothetical protein
MASEEENNNRILELLRQKELACKIEKEAYQRWVDMITIIRFVMIGGAILLACAALGTMIKPMDYLTTQDTIIAVSCSFTAVILAALHIVLEMDKFHFETRKIMNEYAALELKCGRAQAGSYPIMRLAFDEATQKQKEIRRAAKTHPPQWLRQQVQLIETKFY